MFKLVKSFNEGDINKVLILKEQTRTQIYGFKLDKFKFRKSREKNWFTNRVVKHVISARTVDIFKKKVRHKWVKERDDKCYVHWSCLE